ncbi:UNVERIFIED_CONTAM: hypothetical protein Scaly_2194400 [Sesamum calycinum]|uniref:Gag-pol polyprotein n=1 Tax=Sesamum calycinum TaxID=2727403 RepID=A0AAW2MN60_9LAMI
MKKAKCRKNRVILRKMEVMKLKARKTFRSAIKAQALAEFVNGATFTRREEGNWLLHVDGSSTLAGSEAGIVLTSPEGDELEYALQFDFKASNNETEYEALIAGIRMALDTRERNL